MLATIRFLATHIFFIAASIPASAMELVALPAIVIAEREDPDSQILFSRVVYNRQMLRDGSTVHGVGTSLRRFFRFEEIDAWGKKTTDFIPVYQIDNAHEGNIHFSGLSPNEEKIVTTGGENKVKIWHAIDGAWLFTIHGSDEPNKKINVAMFEGNNRIFIDYVDKTNKTWLLPPDNLLTPTKESHRNFVTVLKKYLAAGKNGEIKAASYEAFIDWVIKYLTNAAMILQDLDLDSREYLHMLFPKAPVAQFSSKL